MQKNGGKIKNQGSGRFLSSHLELDKTLSGFCISISGVKGISEFSESEIVAQLSCFSFRIVGKELSLSVFEEKRVEITGKIMGVNILYGKT